MKRLFNNPSLQGAKSAGQQEPSGTMKSALYREHNRILYLYPLAAGTPDWLNLVAMLAQYVEQSPWVINPLIDITGLKDLPLAIMPEINRLLLHQRCGQCAIIGAGFLLKNAVKLWLLAKGHHQVDFFSDLHTAENRLRHVL